MELERAFEFAAGRRNAILTTLRSDGRPQQSVIFYGADGDRFTISVTDEPGQDPEPPARPARRPVHPG